MNKKIAGATSSEAEGSTDALPISGPAREGMGAGPLIPDLLSGPEPDMPSAPIDDKFKDAMTPGYQAEFTPAEADAAGAFQEDALSEADAAASTHD